MTDTTLSEAERKALVEAQNKRTGNAPKDYEACFAAGIVCERKRAAAEMRRFAELCAKQIERGQP